MVKGVHLKMNNIRDAENVSWPKIVYQNQKMTKREDGRESTLAKKDDLRKLKF